MYPAWFTQVQKPKANKQLLRLNVSENGGLPRRHAAPIRIAFFYLYRDASNYKQHGEAVFTNRTFLGLEEIDRRIRSRLHERETFIARQVNLEELFFDPLYEDDPPWHTYQGVEETTLPAHDPVHFALHHSPRDIAEFLLNLEKAGSSGWDPADVCSDLAELQESRRKKLKEAFERGEDILADGQNGGS